jgi:hypothetical protein
MWFTLLLAALVVVVVTGVAVAALLYRRRSAPEGGYFNDGDRAAGVFGVLATGFAVVLGFIVFLAFTSYDESRTGAVTEAQLVAQQYQTAQFLDQPVGADLAAELVCYARHVVYREWPAMEDGSHNESVNPWGLRMFAVLQESDPQSPTEEAAFSTWMDQTSERQIARADRIQGAEGILPWPLWIALFFTAAVIFSYMLFFADSAERAVVQAMHVGTVIAVITTTLLLIAVLGNPYGSRLEILQPTEMERTLDIFDQVAGALQQSEPPCNVEGDPLGA